jgi:hypothetical protein
MKMRKLVMASYLLVLFCCLVGLVAGVAAQGVEPPSFSSNSEAKKEDSFTIRDHAGQLLKLRIRVIEATGKVSANEGAFIDPTARDLEHSLRSLPFNRYLTIDNQSIELSARQRELVKIAEADTLGIRLQYLNEDKIGLWLNWHDAQGVELLNTRMHITKDMPVVVGADSVQEQPKAARILVVTIE